MFMSVFCFRIFIKYFLFHTSFITILFSVISLTAAQINPEIPKVGEKAPFFEFENFSSKKIVEKKNLIIVFYRGHFWGHCQKQLVELQQHFSKLDNKNTKLVAISTDGNDEKNRTLSELGVQFLIIPDEKRKIIRSFGVLHPEEGISRPAVFIIDKKGLVRFRKIGIDYTDRPTVKLLIQILALL